MTTTIELIGDDDGVFGCMSLLGCHDVCPKNLPLATQIAFLRRKMVVGGMEVIARECAIATSDEKSGDKVETRPTIGTSTREAS